MISHYSLTCPHLFFLKESVTGWPFQIIVANLLILYSYVLLIFKFFYVNFFIQHYKRIYLTLQFESTIFSYIFSFSSITYFILILSRKYRDRTKIQFWVFDGNFRFGLHWTQKCFRRMLYVYMSVFIPSVYTTESILAKFTSNIIVAQHLGARNTLEEFENQHLFWSNNL